VSGNPLDQPEYPCHAEAVRAALEAMLGPVEHMDVVRRGYTHNDCVVATLRDGRSVFAKRGFDEMTAGWLRREHQM
jgi:hypothetical protein